MLSRRLPLFVPAALLCLGALLSGCSSTGASTSSSASTSASSPATRSWPRAEVVAHLRDAADRWAGTPHEWGGTTQQGVDCSGLVQSVYATEFDMSLPRTTEAQVRVGREVSRSALQPGDLVFFRPGWKDRHVGLYLSDGLFLHASSSSGVATSDLTRPYWRKRWWQARRVIALADGPDSASESSSAAPDSADAPSTAPTW